MKPPVLAGGVPWLGHAIEFHRNPVELLRRGQKVHGEAFSFLLAGQMVHVLTDPRGNEVFFRASDHQLSAREAYQFTVPMFGKGVAYDVAPELMEEQLRFVMPALRDTRMQTYGRAMQQETEAFTAAFPESGEFDLVQTMNELTVFNACRSLIGDGFRRRLSLQFAEDYHDLEAGVNLIAFFQPYWPLPKMRRRDRARKRIATLLGSVLEERRRRGPSDEDFVDTLLEARYADGRALADNEIIGLLLTLIFAGQHTTAVMAAWTMLLILRHPEWVDRILEEQDRVLGTEPMTLAAIKKMVLLERCIKEAERMYPPLVMLMRTVLTNLNYGPYVLPKGDLVMVAPAVTHMLPHLFENPLRFEPDRFGPGREEDRKSPFSLIGFGGGKHRCIGLAFAQQQVKVIVSVLLRRFELRIDEPRMQPDYSTFVAGPRRPCVVKYRRKPQLESTAQIAAQGSSSHGC